MVSRTRFAVVCLIPKIITEIVKLGGSGFCISAENEVQCWKIQEIFEAS